MEQQQPQKRSALRRALRALGWTVLAIALLLGAAIVYYQFDDALSPEAQAILASPPKAGEPTDDNGYVALLGMGAPAGEDQMAWGKKLVAAYRAQETAGFKKDADWTNTTKTHASFPDKTRWCAPGKDCAASFKAKQADMAKMVDASKDMLARYRVMRSKPAYDEAYIPLRFESAIASFGALIRGQDLATFIVFDKLVAGDAKGALSELAEEVAFHRRVASGARTLIGKMIAARLVAVDALTISELIGAHHAAVSPHAGQVMALLQQLDGSLEMGNAYDPDLYMTVRLLVNLKADSQVLQALDAQSVESALILLAYRPNMAANEHVAMERERLPVLNSGALDFDKARGRAQQLQHRVGQRSWQDYLRNPAGSVILSLGPAPIENYFARLHDGNALVRLVMAQAALLESRAASLDDINRVLAADGGKRFADPYTGKTFAMDANARKLFFEARGSSPWVSDVAGKDKRQVAVSF
jgi:hypothetical protein